jgi:ATP-binding cassette subfamily C protein LapB
LYFTSVVQQAVTILITVWGVVLIYEGRLSIGALIASNLLSSRILAPLGNIAMTLARGQQAISGLKGINSLMQLPRERDINAGPSPEVVSADVEFRKVSFKYPDQERPALSNVSFRISAGERVGIIGKVGSGKTTIGRLLAGLYKPLEGAVLISQSDTRAYDPAELRSGVAFVSQDPELFSGTLRDNIVMGSPGASQEQVARAVSDAGLADLVSAHPAGLQMLVGERGRSLSGGQRQAVALARILLRDPKILFLDEPSSALDSATEQALIRTLQLWSEKPNRTLIVCSHRFAMLNVANRLLVVNEGTVTADGPRDEIIARLSGANKATPSASSPGAP